jgi:hypothetical protein
MTNSISKFAQAHRVANFEKNLKRMKRAGDARNVEFSYSIGPLLTQTMSRDEYMEAWGMGVPSDGYKWDTARKLPSESPQRRKQMDMLIAEKRSWNRYKQPNLFLTRNELSGELIDIVDSPNFTPYTYPFAGVRRGRATNPQEVRDGGEPTYDPTFVVKQSDIYKRRGHIVSVQYGDFADSEWEVLAVLEPLTSNYFERGEQHYLINKMPHLEEGDIEELEVHTLIPEVIDSECEHCNTRRQRKQLLLVRNRETEEVRRVGTTCLMEYTNIDPSIIMKFYQTIDTPTYGDPTIRRSLEQYDLFDFIGKAHRLFGYNNVYEKRMGWTLFYGVFYSPILEGADPSIDGLVLDESISYLVPFDYGSSMTNPFAKFSQLRLSERGKPALPMSEEVVDVASEIISYCANLEGRSDFERNLKIIAQNGIVTKKNSGLAASMWFVWNKAIEDGKLESMFGNIAPEEISEDEEGPLSHHIGELGERIEFTGILMRKSARESHWGTTHLLVFTSIADDNYPAGCEVVWWASTNKRLPDVGDTVKVRGTVKRHGEFKGVENTTIGRGHLTILEN